MVEWEGVAVGKGSERAGPPAWRREKGEGVAR